MYSSGRQSQDFGEVEFGTGPNLQYNSAKTLQFGRGDQFDDFQQDDEYRAGTSQGMRNRNLMDNRKIGTASIGTRPTLKYKQLSTLYPAAKTGSFFNPQGAQQGIESIREDKEAVENLDKWDNEFKIQMRNSMDF